MKTNLKEVKQLVAIYRSITLGQLNAVANGRVRKNYSGVLSAITRFGEGNCLPCAAVNAKCAYCALYDACTDSVCSAQPTYQAIRGSESLPELYEAIQKRADAIELLLRPFCENRSY